MPNETKPAEPVEPMRDDMHILSLDGIRGVAILMVLCHHFFGHMHSNWGWLTAIYNQLGQGWVGVDLFFALSGFLITRILIRSKNKAHYFRDFYVRRSLRIFPLYYAALAVIFVVLLPLGWVAPPGESAANPLWFWTYGTNIYLCVRQHLDLGYTHIPLAHLWSLAVEEHFYLVWPLLVSAVTQNQPRRVESKPATLSGSIAPGAKAPRGRELPQSERTTSNPYAPRPWLVAASHRP